jgi:hypothetical protein
MPGRLLEQRRRLDRREVHPLDAGLTEIGVELPLIGMDMADRSGQGCPRGIRSSRMAAW